MYRCQVQNKSLDTMKLQLIRLLVLLLCIIYIYILNYIIIV